MGWPLYAGAAAGLGAIVWLLSAHSKGQLFAASTGAPPPPGPASKPEAWLLLSGKTIRLVNGRRYRGCVDVPGLVPNSFVASRIPQGARDRGFRDVVVMQSRPAGAPDEDCDLWVEATWDRPDENLERPGAVDLAWELRPG